jgi:hypothetical protein
LRPQGKAPRQLGAVRHDEIDIVGGIRAALVAKGCPPAGSAADDHHVSVEPSGLALNSVEEASGVENEVVPKPVCQRPENAETHASGFACDCEFG